MTAVDLTMNECLDGRVKGPGWQVELVECLMITSGEACQDNSHGLLVNQDKVGFSQIR